MLIDKELGSIIDEYWGDFQKKKMLDFVVKPSIPIIWFGNIEKYKNSQLKIVTVSINPSKNEFEDNTGNSSFWRFKGISRHFSNKERLNDDDKLMLVNAYNSYFELNPYSAYFDYYNRVLKNYFECAYDGQKENTAIHIDLYTPIATNLWKSLKSKEKREIQPSNSQNGEKYILSFLKYLNPDIILFSTRKDELKKVFKIDLNNPILKKTLTKDGKESKGFSMELYKNQNSKQLILYGRNNYGKPFNLGKDFINNVKEDFIKEIYKLRNNK